MHCMEAVMYTLCNICAVMLLNKTQSKQILKATVWLDSTSLTSIWSIDRGLVKAESVKEEEAA